MERMIAILGPHGRREWELLERVASRELSLGALLDAFEGDDLESLRERLSDVDLEPIVATWEKAMLGPAGGIAPDTASHSVAAVRTLVLKDKPFTRSMLTATRLAGWV
jgi:hypothetical protein